MEKIRLSFCDMGFGDEDWKRWEMDVQITCSEEVLQAQVWIEINALTKHLLTANTSDICASDLPAGTEPHSRWHLTITAFVQVAKVHGAEQNVMSRDSPQGQYSYTKIKVFICFSTWTNSCRTHPLNVPSLFSPPGYKNISRNANSSSSFKFAFLDNIKEDHSYAVCQPSRVFT